MRTKYTLPELPYAYDALEPHISRKIMDLHHKGHHGAYVKKANELAAKITEARKAGNIEEAVKLEPALVFNASGHVLHSLFWRCISPQGGGQPSGVLADQITADFGAFDVCKKELSLTAETLQGSGWATLAWDPMGQCLRVMSILNHEHKLLSLCIPILVIDAWEHAYYLQYENKKPDYVAALFNVIDWRAIGARFESARTVRAPNEPL